MSVVETTLPVMAAIADQCSFSEEVTFVLKTKEERTYKEKNKDIVCAKFLHLESTYRVWESESL